MRREGVGVTVIAAGLAAAAWWYQAFAVSYVALTLALLSLGCALVVPMNRDGSEVVLRLGSAKWSEEDFCRHGIVVGQPGVGKTEFARRLIIGVERSHPEAGLILNDEKGDIHRMVQEVYAALGRTEKLVLLRPRPFGDVGPPPPFRMNLIGDRTVSWQSHAQLIVDTAVSQGQKTSQAHFKMQAIDRMAEAMETLHRAGLVVTLQSVYDFVKFPELFRQVLEKMMDHEQPDAAGRERTGILFESWKQYLAKAPEELSGIRGTIENYTNAYVEPEIAEVFSALDPNVSIRDLDRGKTLLFSIPQQFTRARRYVQAFAKILYYRDSLARFDRPAGATQTMNLHLGLFDEGHNSLLASEEGYSDFNTLDKMRSARCPVWFMMQCYTSALPPLEQESKLEVLKANLGTHVIFRLASERGRKLAAGVIGEHEVLERSQSVTQ